MLDATPLLRLYARHRGRRLASLDPVATQLAQMRGLVRAARDTRFGRDHGFEEIETVADFQARVPLRHYDDFWQTYWQDAFPRLNDLTWPGPMPYFAVSSGTTQGTTKYLPVSEAMVASNRKAAADLLVHHIANRPHSRLLAGRSFMLGGSVDLVEEAPGVMSGDLSGIAARTMPWWARLRSFPPRELEAISDWEEKIERFAQAALDADIRAIGGVPSWMLIFFEKLAELKGETSFHINMLDENFELLIHGGVNFDPYRDRFAQLLENSSAKTREVYPASEGFFAIADRGDGDGMRLNLDHGLFYEFVPVDELDKANPTR
ncbi:MAG: GH3 auxin-responsive promoter family protein, partial [Alphaproteobacteria bacterium]|nr:GH3 auxin-responsive promoter family protein [Alphaproteobacteria bacterium]